MKLPIRRESGHDKTAGDDIDLLTSAFGRQIDNWSDFFQPISQAMRNVLPLADVEETDNEYIVDIELPGVKREDVSVEIADDHLIVTGERRERSRVGLIRQQTRSVGRFRYEVTLPSGIDTEAVTATIDNGVLNVVVPKVESARPRKIAITSGGGRHAVTA